MSFRRAPAADILAARDALEWSALRPLLSSSLDERRLRDEWRFVCDMLGLDVTRARPDDDLGDLFARPWHGITLWDPPADDLEYELDRLTEGAPAPAHLLRTLGDVVEYLATHRTLEADDVRIAPP